MPAYPVVKSGILRLAPNAGYHRRRMCLHVFGAIVRHSAYESFTSKPSWKYLGNASDQRALPDESYSVYPLWWAQPSPINLYPVCVFSGDVFNTIDARSAPLPTPHCSTRCAPSMSATKKDLLPYCTQDQVQLRPRKCKFTDKKCFGRSFSTTCYISARRRT